MNYRRAWVILKDMLEESFYAESDLSVILDDKEKEALKTACKALRKVMYYVEDNNDR